MPPIHPALVHFPIALIIFSVVAEFLGILLRNRSLLAAALWSLMGGVIMTAAAIAAGYYDMNRASLTEEVDGYVHLHLRIGWVILAAAVILAGWRWMAREQLNQGKGISYRFAAVLIAALIAFQAWYGGEMVYAHGVSVSAAGQGLEGRNKAKKRLHAVYEFLGAPHGSAHGGAAEHGVSAN